MWLDVVHGTSSLDIIDSLISCLGDRLNTVDCVWQWNDPTAASHAYLMLVGVWEYACLTEYTFREVFQEIYKDVAGKNNNKMLLDYA